MTIYRFNIVDFWVIFGTKKKNTTVTIIKYVYLTLIRIVF